ncbi:uncharacterized protein ASPGLDRAFT_76616 [Aspergillus glaucus CBS 516.65]|uniref:t-SNARE coiled-coil homology domain-containing protein n=1 Tax=Aspergillus glaucus CBS 516.65 TaxID=1160497 RepID=A0A1L9VAQ8_ASPGL|nr:hypothetical protein ASPGLDRAFT_76616 [Aspergillus glaucus CBS 516.65]OJJ80912.1 hypothetical protein ASPGLDRAFT_76616 [Aspergillus glaucus CBS 516.65]
MTLTVFPPSTPTPSTKSPISPASANTIAHDADSTLLTITRLFARLEYNLLSSTADLRPLVRDEFQRMRVQANIDYARTALNTFEKSLSGVKRVDRRYEIQTEVGRKRQTLRALEGVLEEVTAQAEAQANRDDDIEEEEYEGEGELVDIGDNEGVENAPETATKDAQPPSPPEQEQEEEETSRGDSTITNPPTSTLRSRNLQHQHPTATSTSYQTHDQPQPTSPPQPDRAQAQSTEQSLSTSRLEHESLTESLLSLATQLKSSSTSFHTSLESEKSMLDRAVDGLDTTTTNMGAAEKRMGTLRRMTEGKGWWGRMMLYAWILGLWLVAILIVFLGPKLRF